MFEASLDGELYDPEKWAKYYRPFGLEYDASDDKNSSSEKTDTSTTEDTTVTTTESKEEPVKAETAPEVKTEGSAKSAQDILAKIRSRTSAE